MPRIWQLDDSLWFPGPEDLDPRQDIVAVDGDLSPERLLLAYRSGIFPWPHDELLLWFNPALRMVLPPSEVRISHSMRSLIRKGTYQITFDTCFNDVIRRCSATPRPGQDGTWIDEGIIRAYEELHRLGYAHSVESWAEGQLAGGLYGVSLGNMFFGESMFSHRPNASKVAFISLCGWMVRNGFELLDCQVHTDHLASLGAKEIPREQFLKLLNQALRAPDRVGKWEYSG